MARVRKPQPTLESLLFATPEQRVLRLLLGEPTTTLTPRVISSKLKGVRGLGGGEGLARILNDLQSLGLVDFVDNHRAVRLQDDNSFVQIMKTIAAINDLANQVAALPGQILGDAEVLEGFGADFFEAPDGVLLGGGAFWRVHGLSLTTRGCQCQPLVVIQGGDLPDGRIPAYS